MSNVYLSRHNAEIIFTHSILVRMVSIQTSEDLEPFV
jgi:hypothetical protein